MFYTIKMMMKVFHHIITQSPVSYIRSHGFYMAFHVLNFFFFAPNTTFKQEFFVEILHAFKSYLKEIPFYDISAHEFLRNE